MDANGIEHGAIRHERYIHHQGSAGRETERVQRDQFGPGGSIIGAHDLSAGEEDGGMVNIRSEGWKEMQAGAVFDVAIRLERDPRTGGVE
jgi:hypothetical protein